MLLTYSSTAQHHTRGVLVDATNLVTLFMLAQAKGANKIRVRCLTITGLLRFESKARSIEVT